MKLLKLIDGVLNIHWYDKFERSIQMKSIDENKSIDERYNDLMYNRNLPLNVQLEQNNDKSTNT